MNLRELQCIVAEQKGLPLYEGAFLSIDPGETTGIAFFEFKWDIWHVKQWEEKTPDLTVTTSRFTEVLRDYDPDLLVVEDYRVYSWKAKDHTWSDLHTPRVIAAIEVLAAQRGLSPVVKQMAQLAKGFCTDEKLKEWELYVRGKKHARDAVRHACYFILFNAHKHMEGKG